MVTGGNYDVDLELKSPSGKYLYKETKKQYDQIEKTAEENGVYEFCFSNEFSTITHKVIYIGPKEETRDFQCSILLCCFFFWIDWKVDGDPEHEISGANPRVAEGALTMVFLDFSLSLFDSFFFVLDRVESQRSS